jgi:hypothetical protein
MYKKLSFALLVFLSVPTASGSRNSADPVLQRAFLLKQVPAVDAGALTVALNAAECVRKTGAADRPNMVALIDYSRPSTEPRLWVFDLEKRQVLFEELVAHGKNSGGKYAVNFSNQAGSLMSSLGVFVTGGTYQGQHGYTLRLHGLEPGFNDNSYARAIVLHGASYVNSGICRRQGRLGRSHGCPAVRNTVSKRIIDTIRDGAVLVSYYPQSKWLRKSAFVNGCSTGPAS